MVLSGRICAGIFTWAIPVLIHASLTYKRNDKPDPLRDGAVLLPLLGKLLLDPEGKVKDGLA